jgi:hypothetical protein
VSLSEILKQYLPAAEIQARSARIHDEILAKSRVMQGANFQAISVADLKQLFDCYDAEFFDGHLRPALGDCPLLFRMSRRLTSAAGQMTRRTRRDLPQQFRKQSDSAEHFEFEISVSTTILFQSFTDPAARTKASGLPCENRLEALQRVFEHELIHLAEMLVWSDSRCAGPRFQSIARGMFGHREHTHRLVTSREHALTKFGFRVGDKVAFVLDGQRHIGHINRLTRRATVLVADPHGRRYTDGKHYHKFYVPLQMLEPAEQGQPRVNHRA